MTERAGLDRRPGRLRPGGQRRHRLCPYGRRRASGRPGARRSAEEALAFFIRRYEALELEVSLLERRIATGALSPDDAVGSINKRRVRDRRGAMPSATWTGCRPGWTRWLR